MNATDEVRILTELINFISHADKRNNSSISLKNQYEVEKEKKKEAKRKNEENGKEQIKENI